MQTLTLLPAASIGDWFHETALDGSLALAMPVALVAGLVSFFSPCVIPLLPGYLSYVTGLSSADIVAGGSTGIRSRLVVGVSLFILGFSAVYVTLGGIFGQIGAELYEHRDVLTKALGVFIILLGLVFVGAVPFLQRDVRVHTLPAVGLGAAPFIGAIFALGWTPCTGPTLGAILGLSGTYGSSPGRGALLAFVYCLGLGVPFLIAAISFHKMMRAVSFVRRHQQWVMRIGGGMLIAVGVLLVTGLWDQLIAEMRSWVSSYETVV